MSYETIQVRFQDPICFIQIHRPKANNTINKRLIEEIHSVLNLIDVSFTILVLEGLPDVFCFGADFEELHAQVKSGIGYEQHNESIYNLWLRLSSGPFITISLVRGKVNAGGVGFIAASDIVLADNTAQFSLSEMLFGLFPACVMPFLIRKIGFQKTNYMALMTQPIFVEQACTWGLVDASAANVESLLRKKLPRLLRLNKKSIAQYKSYANEIYDLLLQAKLPAIEANRDNFSDSSNLRAIQRYVEKGMFPWERE